MFAGRPPLQAVASNRQPNESEATETSNAFKAKVDLEALAGVKTVAELARESHQVHPAQVSQWKRAIVDRLP